MHRSLGHPRRFLPFIAALWALGAGALKADEDFVAKLSAARIVELNFVWDQNSPLLAFNPPYALALANSHQQTNGWIPDLSFAADMMYFSGQHGAPTIDALGHIGTGGKLYGGLDVAASEGPGGLTALGIEHYPGERFVNRGVLLDVARHKEVDTLEPGYEITAEDLDATAAAQGVEVRAGDSVLIRTGYGKFFESDKDKYMGLRPGPGEGAARWLAEKDVFLAGDDQLTFEVFPEGGTVFPVHRILIAENGIYIVENLNLESLAEAAAGGAGYEFAVVMNPPRIRGATAAPLNAFAILPQ